MSGVIFPFLLATLWARSSGFPTPQALFVASAFVATSAGITARVLQELKVLGRRESRIILGAAVIDDILAMLLLGGVTALQGGKGINIGGLTLVLGQAIGFIVLIMVVGTRFMQRKSALLDRPLSPHSPLMLSLALCLGLAAASSKLGLAAIIGAFLAGTVVAESQQRHTLSKQIQPILAFLVPFFFVTTGLKVDLTQLGSGRALITVLFVTALAVIGKWVGCGLTSLMEGRRSAMIIGVGMVPRGEVGIIIASLGQQIGVFTGQVYAILIAMSLLTSVIAPPLLKWLLGNPSPEPGTEASPLFAVEETGHDSGV
jgi:Kef-type K+ transport system membrane component KefB